MKKYNEYPSKITHFITTHSSHFYKFIWRKNFKFINTGVIDVIATSSNEVQKRIYFTLVTIKQILETKLLA